MICIGCKEKIVSGAELYFDKKLAGSFGILRFYGHLTCLQNGNVQHEAQEILAQLPATLVAL